MSTRSTNTQAEALGKVIRTIADIKQYPDADLPWLIELETFILQYLKEPLERMGQQANPGVMPGGAPVTPTGRPGAMPPGPPQAPSADSLQRMMSGRA